MKKILILLLLLASPVYAIDMALIGTMWKQEGTVVSPADDVTSVTGIGDISEGDDVIFGSGIFSTTLDEATGSETAVLINYTTNKATSGGDTSLYGHRSLGAQL